VEIRSSAKRPADTRDDTNPEALILVEPLPDLRDLSAGGLVDAVQLHLSVQRNLDHVLIGEGDTEVLVTEGADRSDIVKDAGAADWTEPAKCSPTLTFHCIFICWGCDNIWVTISSVVSRRSMCSGVRRGLRKGNATSVPQIPPKLGSSSQRRQNGGSDSRRPIPGHPG